MNDNNITREEIMAKLQESFDAFDETMRMCIEYSDGDIEVLDDLMHEIEAVRAKRISKVKHSDSERMRGMYA